MPHKIPHGLSCTIPISGPLSLRCLGRACGVLLPADVLSLTLRLTTIPSCRDCTTTCGAGLCASSDTECAAIVGTTIITFGVAAADLDDCPDPQRGTWPDDNAQRQSDEAVSRCGDLAELYGLSDAGEYTDSVTVDEWRILGCSEKVCGAWKEAYGIKPGSDWGSMPEKFRAAWDALGCNNKWSAFDGWLERQGGR